MTIKDFLVKNQTALIVWAGTALTAGVQYASGQNVSSADLIGVVIGLAKIVEPSLAITVAQIQQDIADVQAVIAKPSVQTVEKAVTDAEGIVNGIVAAPAVTPNQ